jgi:hypothetical protein
VAEPVLNLLGPLPYHVYNSMQDPFAPASKWRCSAVAIADSTALVDAIMKLEPLRPSATAHGLGTDGRTCASDPCSHRVLSCRELGWASYGRSPGPEHGSGARMSAAVRARASGTHACPRAGSANAGVRGGV